MNGYKTGGDWTDVTSIGRNEVVFEGRHKAYGAFYIRQRYPNALLFSLLTAISLVVMCAVVPYALRGVHHLVPVKPDVVITPIDPILHPRVITPPPPSHPHVQPPRMTPNRFFPPAIARQPIDSAPPITRDNHTSVIPTGTPGTGTQIIDPNPGLPGGGGSSPIPEDNSIRTWVSEMPKFPGNIQDYLAKQIQYSPEEVQLGVQGIVYTSFVIEKDGSVSNVSILKGISNGPDLNREAMRVISQMPKWTPGKQNGHPVRIQYMVPIHFKLQ